MEDERTNLIVKIVEIKYAFYTIDFSINYFIMKEPISKDYLHWFNDENGGNN